MKKEFILFDTEYTCWEGSMARNWSGKGETIEIIQWGALKINEYGEVIDKFDYFCKPLINHKLSNYCKKLTNIKQKNIDTAINIKELLIEFNKFDNNGKIKKWSWGNDINVIVETGKINNLIIENQDSYYDLSQIFKLEKIDCGGSSSGELASFFGVSMDGHVHDANFDTFSLFKSIEIHKNKILKHLF